MSANKDFLLQKKLIRYFIKDERASEKVRSVVFYEHVKSELMFYTIPKGETQSKTMKELRDRFNRGSGQKGEPTKFMSYFYRKFMDDIKKERKLIYGHPYRESSYMKRKRYK